MDRIRITYNDYKKIHKEISKSKPSSLLTNERNFCLSDFEIQIDIEKNYQLKATIHLDDYSVNSGENIKKGKRINQN